jgi:hypothetical protein
LVFTPYDTQSNCLQAVFSTRRVSKIAREASENWLLIANVSCIRRDLLPLENCENASVWLHDKTG